MWDVDSANMQNFIFCIAASRSMLNIICICDFDYSYDYYYHYYYHMPYRWVIWCGSVGDIHHCIRSSGNMSSSYGSSSSNSMSMSRIRIRRPINMCIILVTVKPWCVCQWVNRIAYTTSASHISLKIRLILSTSNVLANLTIRKLRSKSWKITFFVCTFPRLFLGRIRLWWWYAGFL